MLKNELMMEKPLKTKEKLIQTAIELIWRSGYASVSVDEICKQAGVKKGSFYHFFPSKVDLTLAAMDEAFSQFRPFLDQSFAKQIDPVERFLTMAEYGLNSQKEITRQYGRVCGCPFVTLGAEMAPHNEAIRQKTDNILQKQRQYYERALADLVAMERLPSDTNIKTKARKIQSFIMGQLVMARIQNSLDPLQEELKTGLVRMIGAEKRILETA